MASPGIALSLGVLVGIILLSPVAWGLRYLLNNNVDAGLAIVMGSVFGGLLVALGAMFGYRALSPEGFMWFGPSVVGGFVVALGILAVWAAATVFKSGGKSN